MKNRAYSTEMQLKKMRIQSVKDFDNTSTIDRIYTGNL